VASERFYVEVAPGFVRLGLRTNFGRQRLTLLEEQVVRSPEDMEEGGESIEWEPPDPDDFAWLVAREDEERQFAEDALQSSVDPLELVEYLEELELAAAKKAGEGRIGRGARGMSERSRREMWRRVLSLPFEMLGARPLWIILTYPGDWRNWVPDLRTLERHRRAFGEAWYQVFGERLIGFWSKQFQLLEGRPHLHLS
jgi:hypothetical protein